MTRQGPVEKKERIEGLDVLRGLAIFGILVVNVLQMFRPLYLANWPVAIVPGEIGMWPSWFLIDALFENKFITIFSLLFGAGFGLQLLRTGESRRDFRRLYLGRIGILIIFGLVHAVYFYMADVLVIYGLAALLLMLFRHWPVRRLFWVSGVLLGLMAIWNMVLSGPHDPEMAATQRSVVEEIARIRVERVIELENTEFPLPMPADVAILVLDGNNEPEQAKVEYAVFSEGPLRAARSGRMIFFATLIILYTPFYLVWRTLALFILGMALVKWGFLEIDRRRLWRRVSIVGFAVGIPMTLVATTIRAVEYERQSNLVYLGATLHDLSSLFLAAAISSAVLLWCAAGRRRAVRSGFGAVGRTALTNYFGQSVVMSLIATSYGLGLYGDLTHVQLLLLSVVCFLCQMGVSYLWLRACRMGPLEWLWRCLTYRRVLPLRIEASQ